MRILRDPTGRQWNVWRVIPDPSGYIDRRREDRCRFQDPAYAGEERRQRANRRGGGSIMDGWLVFQSGAEKRRLVPVPADLGSVRK